MLIFAYTLKLKDMTTQDLKDSKTAIIERINEIADVTRTKEIMTCMLNLVEGNMNDATEAVELVDEVVALLNAEKKEKGGFVVNGVDYDTQAAYQRACLGSKWSK
jgi:hypothetical protein